jgi:type I restriction enzyme S subunit
MKDSGVAWLGEVPAHWTVSLIKRYCHDITDGAHISPETEGVIYDFISTKDLSNLDIDFSDCLKTSAETYDYMVRTGCRPAPGDILFSKDGTIGRTALVKEDRPFVVASSLIIIRPDNKKYASSYLHWLLQSASVVGQVECMVKGAGLPRLSIQNLLKVVGTLPPPQNKFGLRSELKR